MKKFISVLLMACLVLAMAAPTWAAGSETVQPRYVNTSHASITMSISSSGLATVDLLCTGLSSVTHIDAVVYLERQVGSSWVRVDNGTSHDTWTVTSANRFMMQSITHQLTVKGTYRAKVTYTVYGASYNEVLTFENTREYK